MFICCCRWNIERVHLGSILQNIEGDVYEVLRVERHNGYNPNTFPYENDLAIITLKKNVVFTSTVHHICLPKRGEVFYGKGAQVAGKVTIYDCFSRLSEKYYSSVFWAIHKVHQQLF